MVSGQGLSFWAPFFSWHHTKFKYDIESYIKIIFILYGPDSDIPADMPRGHQIFANDFFK